MTYLILKLFLSAGMIVAVSEIAKRSGYLGALIASLPLTSILAIVWLYLETGSSEKIGALTTSIFWFVLPSLVFFIALPLLLRWGLHFWISVAASCIFTGPAYWRMTAVLRLFKIGEINYDTRIPGAFVRRRAPAAIPAN